VPLPILPKPANLFFSIHLSSTHPSVGRFGFFLSTLYGTGTIFLPILIEFYNFAMQNLKASSFNVQLYIVVAIGENTTVNPLKS
jgi:uncharacterized protein (AIM24 family)